jgi:hypothetical protein
MIGLSKPLRHYYPTDIANKNLYHLTHHSLLNAEEAKLYQQAAKKILKLYKKLEVFEPVSAALETMRQDRLMALQVKHMLWPMHNARSIVKIKWLDDPHSLPTKLCLYTGNQGMMEEQRKKHRFQFMWNCADCTGHRF